MQLFSFYRESVKTLRRKMFYKGGENCTKLGMQNHCMVKKVGAPDFMYYRLSSKHAILNVCTLQYGIMVPSGINVPPGKFGKKNNRTPWNKHTPWKTMESL